MGIPSASVSVGLIRVRSIDSSAQYRKPERFGEVEGHLSFSDSSLLNNLVLIMSAIFLRSFEARSNLDTWPDYCPNTIAPPRLPWYTSASNAMNPAIK